MITWLRRGDSAGTRICPTPGPPGKTRPHPEGWFPLLMGSLSGHIRNCPPRGIAAMEEALW